MFKKTNSPGKDAFADRLRRVSEQQPPPVYSPPPPRKSDARSPRQALYKNGVIAMGAGRMLNVAVKNVSATGAHIEFVERSDLPEEVTLIAPMLGIKRRARVVWQREGAAGLQYLD